MQSSCFRVAKSFCVLTSLFTYRHFESTFSQSVNSFPTVGQHCVWQGHKMAESAVEKNESPSKLGTRNRGREPSYYQLGSRADTEVQEWWGGTGYGDTISRGHQENTLLRLYRGCHTSTGVILVHHGSIVTVWWDESKRMVWGWSYLGLWLPNWVHDLNKYKHG